jgi:ankyrin repeat protein
MTPLHILSECWIKKRGLEVNRRVKGNDTPLLPLEMRRDSDRFKLARVLLERGADPNAKDHHGMTSLHILTSSKVDDEDDALKLVKLLLYHGATVYKRDKNDDMIHRVIRWRQFNLAGILVEHDADANAENNYGETPLHILIESKVDDQGDALHLARLLLEHGAAVNSPSEYGVTLLHETIQDAQFNLAGFLVEHGADVNRQNAFKETPLYLAIAFKKFDLAELLLEHGADANAENEHGSTPLHRLSETKIEYEEVLILAHLLLENDAEVNRQDSVNETPLHIAIRFNLCELAKILLEHGGVVNAENNNGMTPLHILSESRIKDKGDVLNLARLLLDYGAEVNRGDKDNETPLHLAIRWNELKLAEFLLEHFADANSENSIGMTSLHILSDNKTKDEGDILNLLQLLLKHGAEVNSHNRFNETPLHLAIRQERFTLAGFLLEHGTDANAENNNGKTPLQILLDSQPYYSEGDFMNHAQLLLQNGLGVTRGDGDNETLLLRGKGKGKSSFIIINLSADSAIEKDLDTQDENRITRTYLRSNLGSFQIATLLLHHGATFNAPPKTSPNTWLDGPSYPEIEGGYYLESYCVVT